MYKLGSICGEEKEQVVFFPGEMSNQVSQRLVGQSIVLQCTEQSD